MRKVSFNWRLVLIVVSIAVMICTVGIMLFSKSEPVANGRVDFSEADLKQHKWVALNGKWEFYFNQLLTAKDFSEQPKPEMADLIKVPGSWADKKATSKSYPGQGVATYRLTLHYPDTIKDPALSIKTVSTAYRVYVNGQLAAEVGSVSDHPAQFKEGAGVLIIDLPSDKQDVELIFQVANLNYAKGGLRESPAFGSKQVLEQQRNSLMALQLLFIGSVLIFGVYYLLHFVLQTNNKTALIFSILCFITGMRSLIWGELPIMIFFPNISYAALGYINYVTAFNLIPLMLLFIISIYPSEYKRISLRLVLLPSLFFNGLLLTSPKFMSYFTGYLLLLILLQMTYMMGIMIKAVLNKRENAVLMFIAIWIYILAICQDILHVNGDGRLDTTIMFLYGKIAVIIAMAYIQAKLQSNTYKKLLLYNANLIEADRLKDKILATEMSFLQAQIKPHFLYNALNAIANVCEKDGPKAGNLIIDLAVYLRGSLEFNNLDKMVLLEKELEFVDTYFHIEQARFGHKIQLIKEIDSPLSFQLPILMLQPLVENAVGHGISKKIGGGTVFVSSKQTSAGTYFEIKDDGIGIEPEKLEMILSDDRSGMSVGLLNIHQRLLRMYGSGLVITSEEGVGTTVTFLIPGRDLSGKPTNNINGHTTGDTTGETIGETTGDKELKVGKQG